MAGKRPLPVVEGALALATFIVAFAATFMAERSVGVHPAFALVSAAFSALAFVIYLHSRLLVAWGMIRSIADFLAWALERVLKGVHFLLGKGWNAVDWLLTSGEGVLHRFVRQDIKDVEEPFSEELPPEAVPLPKGLVALTKNPDGVPGDARHPDPDEPPDRGV